MRETTHPPLPRASRHATTGIRLAIGVIVLVVFASRTAALADGGCCLDSGVCINVVDQSDCALIDGSFIGEGITCMADPDEDGAVGCDDGCPLDPFKIDPGQCGCGVEDSDEDLDFVADCIDQCPGTEPGLPVDELGCPAVGACCFEVGLCAEALDPVTCSFLSGIFQGNGSTCSEGCGLSLGDFDGDGDVDLDDYFALSVCLFTGGPDVSPLFGCTVFDFDSDGDVDVRDVADWVIVFDPPAGCVADAECDDGLFCNGMEVCVVALGECILGEEPCPIEECDEDLDMCGPIVFEFTLEIDELVGGGGDDVFDAPLIFNQGTGTLIPSLQSGDSADGGGGYDVLDATFNFSSSTMVVPVLASIEEINIVNLGTAPTTLAGGGITGTADINLSNSTNTNAFLVTNLPSIVNLGVSNQAVGATVTLATAATSGGEDEATISVNGITGGTITYTTGTINGLETLNIDSSGADSSLTDISMNGTTLTTINITGDAHFTMSANSLDANVEMVDASGSSGGVSLIQSNAGDFTFLGGTGDDTINLGATYNTLDILDGGAGIDTLVGTNAAFGGILAPQTNVTNIEHLVVQDQLTTFLTPSHFGSIMGVTLAAGSNGGSLPQLSTGFQLNCGLAGTSPAGAGMLAATVSGSGTTDSLNYVLNDCDQNGAVTFTGAETVNLMSNLDLDGSAASGGANVLGAALTLTDTAASEQLLITGTEALTITGAVTANVINASSFAHAFTMGATTVATGGVTLNGGSAADTLFGSTSADIIDGGAGNDIINPMNGSDLVTGGSGADTFRQADGAAANRQTITDFDDTVTTGDIFNFNSGVATLTGTDNFATSGSIQTHFSSGNVAINAAAEVVVVFSGTVNDNLNSPGANSLNGLNLLTAIGGTITAAIAGQNDILLVVADTNGNLGVYYASSADNAIVAGEIALVAVLQANANLAIGNLVFNNFSNGF